MSKARNAVVSTKPLLQRIWEARQAYLFLLPLFVGLAIFSYYPPISGIIGSFFDWTPQGDSVFVGWGNFQELFSDPYFLNSIPTMFKIMIPKLIIGIVMPLVMAELIFAITAEKRRYFYRVAVLLPMIAPGVVFMMVWKFMYDPVNGPITAILRATGIMQPDQVIGWLSDPATVIPAIIFMGFPWVGGTSVLIYMSGLMNLSGEMIESAKLDGANVMQRIFFIDIPMLLGQIKYFLVFGIIGGLQDYGTQIVLTKGGPGYSTYVPGYYMYMQAFNNGRMGYASAIGTVMFLTIFILTVLNYRFFNSDATK